jgi:hypothetical protein
MQVTESSLGSERVILAQSGHQRFGRDRLVPLASLNTSSGPGYGTIVLVLPSPGGNELRRDASGMLLWSMAHTDTLREAVEYRGYSLQVTYTSPQWQVLIGMVLKDRPALPPGKQIVKGWNDEETLKRAKTRVDLLIESPSLH